VLDLVKRLGQQGLAVVLISHDLLRVLQVADRITVLRLGRVITGYRAADERLCAGRERGVHGRDHLVAQDVECPVLTGQANELSART
jgi:ABC-type sugar transport system ATPase subunit